MEAPEKRLAASAAPVLVDALAVAVRGRQDASNAPGATPEVADGGDAGDVFAPWLANQRSPQTVRAYAADWAEFQAWCAERGVTDIRAVSMELLVGYRNWLRDERALRAASIARKLSTIRQAMQYAHMLALIERNPATLIKSFHVPQVSPRSALPDSQVRSLLAEPDRLSVIGARDYALLMIGLHLGLRRSELADLRCGDISQERSHYTLYVAAGKGEKDRLLPLPAPVHEAILRYLLLDARPDALTATPGAPLFLPTRANNPQVDLSRAIAPQLIWRRVKHYARLAGIVNHPHLDAHTLRATAITNALEHGAQVRRVQAMAGHADPKTTIRYDSRRGDLDSSAVYQVHYDQ